MTAEPFGLLDLTGQVALVVGAGGGIGSAVAARLASAGALVVGADVPGHAAPAGARFVPCDVRDSGEVRALLASVAQDPGRLDILVHCAGVTRDGVLWKMRDEDWDEVLAVNLRSAFTVLREATPLLRQRGGAVVLVSSINGARGKAGQANYAASKAGVDALARTAARELGRFDVRVNAVAPGWIDTAMTASLPDTLRQRALEESMLGRLGEPDDVARVVLFLASTGSRHVTGQVIRVDGGQLIG